MAILVLFSLILPQALGKNCLGTNPSTNEPCNKPNNKECMEESSQLGLTDTTGSALVAGWLTSYDKTTTISGAVCKTWNSLASDPDGTIPNMLRIYMFSISDNKCRNPLGREGPWCYSTNANKQWEYCYNPCSSGDIPIDQPRVAESSCGPWKADTSIGGRILSFHGLGNTPAERETCCEHCAKDPLCTVAGSYAGGCWAKQTVQSDQEVQFIAAAIAYPKPKTKDITLEFLVDGTKHVDQGVYGLYRATTGGLCMYKCFHCTDWKNMEGSCSFFAAGLKAVWAMKSNGYVYLRKGVSDGIGEGKLWEEVTLPQGETGIQIACSNQDDSLWLVTASANLYKRIGTVKNMKGHGWQKMKTGIKTVSVGLSGVWAASDSSVYYLKDSYGGIGDGDQWIEIPGKGAKYIASGRFMVYIVTSANELWVRIGITEKKPAGDGWWYKQASNILTVTADKDGSVYVTKSDNAAYVKEGKFRNCKCSEVEIVDKNMEAVEDGMHIIGIGTGVTCAKGKRTITMENKEEARVMVGLTTTKGGSFDWGASVGVKFETGFGALGNEAKISVSVLQSFSWSNTWSSATTKGSHDQKIKKFSYGLNFEGPGSAMVIGWVNKYRLDRGNVTAKYHIKCDGGTQFVEKAAVKLSTSSFGKAHFTDLAYKFNAGQCKNETMICVQKIDVGKKVKPKELEQKFKDCFKNGVGTEALRR